MRRLITRWPIIFLLGLLIFIEFANYRNFVGFDYDQEVNAFWAKSFLVDHKLLFIGPETSVGGMYVGPYFNYVISLFYLLGRMNPQATILLNIFISLGTLAAVYFVGKAIFSPRAGAFAVIFFGASYLLAKFATTLWNPTPLPLVSLGVIYLALLYSEQKKPRQLWLLVFLTALTFHLHFVAVIMAGYLLVTLIVSPDRRPTKVSLAAAAILFLMFLPLGVFDLRHGLINSRHALSLLTTASSGLSPLPRILDVLYIYVGFSRAVFYNHPNKILDILSGAFLAGVIVYGFKGEAGRPRQFVRVTLLLLLITLVVFTLYKGPLPSQYFLPIFAPLTIIFSGFLSWAVNSYRWLIFPVWLLTLALIFVNVGDIAGYQSGLSLYYKNRVARFIQADSAGRAVRVEVISDPGQDTGFGYLLWQNGVNVTAAKWQIKYKIVVPYYLVAARELTARFGGIGIIRE